MESLNVVLQDTRKSLSPEATVQLSEGDSDKTTGGSERDMCCLPVAGKLSHVWIR